MKKTLTIRIELESDVKALEHAQALLHETTATKAILQMIRLYGPMKHRINELGIENEKLLKNNKEIAEARDNYKKQKNELDKAMKSYYDLLDDIDKTDQFPCSLSQ